MMRMLRGFVVSALVAGCVALHAGTPMETAVSELSMNGDYFSVTNAKPLLDLLQQIGSVFAAAPRKADVPDAHKEFVAKSIDMLALLFRKAGLNEIAAYGASSVKNGDFYHNRGVVVLDEGHRGHVWAIPETYDGDILKLMGETFPANVEMAALVGIDLRPLHRATGVIVDSLKEDGELSSETEAVSSFLGMLLDTHGMLHLAMLGDGSAYIGYPDAENRIFDALPEYFRSVGIQFLTDDNGGTYTVMEGTISFTRGKDVLHILSRVPDRDAAPCKDLLKENEHFTALSAGLSGNRCFMAIYLPESGIDLNILDYPLSFDGKEGGDLLATVSFDGTKLVFDGSNTLSWPQSGLSAAIIIPLIALDCALTPGEQIKNLLNEACGDDSGDNAENKDAEHLATCVGNLKEIGAAVARLEKEGKPLPGDVTSLAAATGLKDAWDCPSGLEKNDGAAGSKYSDYIYFGSWTGFGDPKLPVLVDWPGNHVDKFNVLYADGTVETLDMENITSIRKQVSKLHSVHNYPERTFSELLRRADKLDLEFELEQHHEQ